MFNFKKKKHSFDIYAVANGVIKPVSDVKDEVFSKGLVGVGYAIEPVDNIVYAPFEGEITMIFPTKHAIGIKTENGIEGIIHIGIDTVGLKGEGFEILIAENQKVSTGTPLVKVDYELIKSHYLITDVICVMQNTNDFELIKAPCSTVNIKDKVAKCESGISNK